MLIVCYFDPHSLWRIVYTLLIDGKGLEREQALYICDLELCLYISFPEWKILSMLDGLYIYLCTPTWQQLGPHYHHLS
jgi:hypothetical protein